MEKSRLSEVIGEIMETLKTNPPAYIEGVPEELHELPGMMPRQKCKELGSLVTAREAPTNLEGSKWASLRLDGCLWGTLMKRLRESGVIGTGYSDEIGEIMRACCRAVIDEFKADVGFTHSDEMTIVLAPRRSLPNGRHADFPYNGRVQKWVSIAASVATALFNRLLGRLAASKGITLDDDLIAHFDCRVGVFDSEEEATALVLWRAYDCSVNCTQDACYHNGAPPEILGDHFAEKLRWLYSENLLPLQPHQAYGSLFVRTLAELDAEHPETREKIRVNRRVNIHVNDGADATARNLLNFFRSGLKVLRPVEGDSRLSLREGSYWRYAGPSGSGESVRSDRSSPPWKNRNRRGDGSRGGSNGKRRQNNGNGSRAS